MKNRTSYERTNDVEIVRMDLILDSGDRVSMKDMYVSIDFFQDIFGGTPLHCEMVVGDGLDLYNALPFKNNEILDIEFYSPGGSVVSKQLRMYSREQVILNNAGTSSTYKLYFASPETITNVNVKVSRSYTGTLSDICGAIWSDNFPNSDPIKLESSEDSQTLILPYATPFAHINFLSKRALRKDGNECNFVFFEDFTGFSFVSLGNLFEQPSRKDAFYKYGGNPDVNQLAPTDLLAKRYMIQDVDILGKENYIDQVSNGVYTGYVQQYDMKNKIIGGLDYSYDEAFGATPSLNEFPITTNKISSTAGFLANYQVYNGKFAGNKLKRMSQINSFLNKRIRFLVAGNSSVNIGDKINVQFEKQKALPGSDFVDKYRSGFYLVSSIKHTLSKVNGYSMTVEACTDSYAAQIPDESRFESKVQQGELR